MNSLRTCPFSVFTGVQVYLCNPKSLWQRKSNENTDGLLHQYLPKGRELSRIPRGASTPRPENLRVVLDRPDY